LSPLWKQSKRGKEGKKVLWDYITTHTETERERERGVPQFELVCSADAESRDGQVEELGHQRTEHLFACPQ
jgi:hypothetical protein